MNDFYKSPRISVQSSVVQFTVNSQQSTVSRGGGWCVPALLTVNSQQSTVNSQQSTVNSQQSTVNSQQLTVNSQQSTVNMMRSATGIDITCKSTV
ncbi:hypothetical protein [Microcoleus sp.]|uniref:hypothetical protein n=1 Tax=Microcoleus sp. TaxID=44472 RepID=UPI003593FC8F